MTRAWLAAFLVYTNIWRRDLLACSQISVYACVLHVVRTCVRVLRAQEQLASATRSSSGRNVMFARSGVCGQSHTSRIYQSTGNICIYVDTIYINYIYIYDNAVYKPALTISLIVYATGTRQPLTQLRWLPIALELSTTSLQWQILFSESFWEFCEKCTSWEINRRIFLNRFFSRLEYIQV